MWAPDQDPEDPGSLVWREREGPTATFPTGTRSCTGGRAPGQGQPRLAHGPCSILCPQPDFWDTHCGDRHHWGCPGSGGCEEVQESQPAGRAPHLRLQPACCRPLPLPGSHPGPGHSPGLLRKWGPLVRCGAWGVGHPCSRGLFLCLASTSGAAQGASGSPISQTGQRRFTEGSRAGKEQSWASSLSGPDWD